eukprot:scaffold437281_cov15-Prasinocladus_malaysianus.AAC.1
MGLLTRGMQENTIANVELSVENVHFAWTSKLRRIAPCLYPFKVPPPLLITECSKLKIAYGATTAEKWNEMECDGTKWNGMKLTEMKRGEIKRMEN